MRLRTLAPALAALPLLLGACGGGDDAAKDAGEATEAGEPWVVVEPGRRTPSAGPSFKGSPRPGLPPVSFLPTDDAACGQAWPQDIGQVLIPMQVTPAAGSLRVQWPNRYGNVYRVTAVPQELVSGAQPEPVWQTVTTGGECTAGATIGGLVPGDPYIVWLDAPETPRERDGSRDLYSGKSGVVRPL